MTRSIPAALAAIALLSSLGGCQRAPAGSQPGAAASDTPTAAPPLPALSQAPAITRETPTYTRDPVEALDWWAAAIEARDWPAVRAFWGDRGERSGLDDAAFAAKWDVLASPQVTIGAGAQEGAAGSLYYTAPITIADGARTITGEVTIRRVNDVTGATTEQLRWHLEALTLPL